MSPHQRDQLLVFGYEFWLWGSVALVLLCTIIYSIMACYNKRKVRAKDVAGLELLGSTTIGIIIHVAITYH